MYTSSEIINQLSLLDQCIKTFTQAIHDDTGHEYMRDTIIQRFEYSIELSWKTLKKLFEYKWFSDLKYPKDIIRKAYEIDLIQDVEIWITLIDHRNTLSHVYSWEQAEDIFEYIKDHYQLFEQLAHNLHNQSL